MGDEAMIWRVEIKDKPGVFDSLGDKTQKDILDLGIAAVQSVVVTQVYLIEADLSSDQIRRIAQQLLVDPLVQEFDFLPYAAYIPPRETASFRCVEIAYNPGVMDPVEASTMKGIKDLGFEKVTAVRTAKKYVLNGSISASALDTMISKILANKLIQHVVDHPVSQKKTSLTLSALGESFDIKLVPLLKASDRQLLNISRLGQLFLNLAEMQQIKKYFQTQGRNPTDCELETIAQTWSEHCHHKTFRGQIDFEHETRGRTKKIRIKNLLKSTIMKATLELRKPWCVSVFHDNAGVMTFDQTSHVCFKVETHNHPSALEPFGGANTGVGGVIRDTLGTGLAAKPIANTDIFCFAPPDVAFDRLPAGTLHPKRIMKGVISGVRDYGNKMGIPTVNGAIVFHEQFVGNPLVFCGSVGLLPKGKVEKKVRPGDLIVVLGGRTGRDGIHGATFSSGELTHESEVVSSGAVQIGDPIQEKKVLDCLMQARDEDLFHAITDCGAGGFSSAVGEMAKDTGCRVELERAPLKYKGLTYTEIWISESQERMVLAVSPYKLKRLLEICEKENVEAAVLGEFTGTGRLELFFHNCQVGSLDMKFLHDGIPQIVKKAVWRDLAPGTKEPKIAGDLTQALKIILAQPTVASKESVIRQYDHEVQAQTVIKPLVGVHSDGPSDACVLKPKFDSYRGLAVANGINPRYGLLDPYWMAASCMDEAIRQIIVVGGSLKQLAILDNFCWGNPDKPDRLGALVRAAQACYQFSTAYGVPFISGKDSLYNEYTDRGRSMAIPGTLLVSSIGIVEDIRRCVTMDLKKEGNLIYLLGDTAQELGGSIYFETCGLKSGSVPRVDAKAGVSIYNALTKAIAAGYVASAHDCSEGGLGVALAEMAFSGQLGITIFLEQVPYRGKLRNDYILFSESNTRIVVEVPAAKQKDFEKIFKRLAHNIIGFVDGSDSMHVLGLQGEPCVEEKLTVLKAAWQKPLAY